MSNRILPTGLAALLAASLIAGLPTAGAQLPVATRPVAVPARTVGPVPRQSGTTLAPFRMLLLVAEPGSSAPINNLTSTNDPLYPGWCDLYGFGAGGSGAARSSGSTVTVGKPSLDALTINRAPDAKTTALFSRLVAGKASDFTLVIVRGTPQRTEAWKIKCTGAYVSEQSFSATGTEVVESDSISFTTMEWSYTETDANGNAVDEVYANYNVATGRGTGGTRPPNYPGGQDANNNGIPDGWESFYGLDLTQPGQALLDFDGDGQNNLQEYLAGTVPNDPKSVLRVSAVGRISVGGAPTVTLTWTSVANKTYVVQSADQPGGPWTGVKTVSGTGTGTTTTTVDASGPARFFYRVVVSP